jgi:hypothetical protein
MWVPHAVYILNVIKLLGFEKRLLCFVCHSHGVVKSLLLTLLSIAMMLLFVGVVLVLLI